jgi:hydroxymethylbilane synthase
MKTLRIGTRGSALALWQARAVANLIEAAHGCSSEICVIRTAGDRLQDAPLSEAGGKGLFVKDIEDALLDGTIDLAVHSAKDMSVRLPEGLVVPAVLPREDSRDALVLPPGVKAPGKEPRIGTGSVRRSAQLRSVYRDARFLPIRGNVDTRLRKLDAGEYDALVLAVAGLTRLGHDDRITLRISHDDCVPAPCQGIVAIEARGDDRDTAAILRPINDVRSAACFEAERAVVSALGGGCDLPLGVVAVHTGDRLVMQALATSADGARQVRRRIQGDASRPAELGRQLADDLAGAGAIAILNEVRY